MVHGNFKGGRIKDDRGYILIFKPDHPFAMNNNYVMEHRLVWEEANNAILLPWSHIHHKNGIRDDNRPENLEAMTKGQHMRLERLANPIFTNGKFKTHYFNPHEKLWLPRIIS